MSKLSNSILIFISSIIILSSKKVDMDLELIWIDPKVNNEENKEYQKKFNLINDVRLSCFEKVSKGIKFLKT